MMTKMTVEEIRVDLAEIKERESYVLHPDDRICALNFGLTALALYADNAKLIEENKRKILEIDWQERKIAGLQSENDRLKAFAHEYLQGLLPDEPKEEK